MPATPGTRSAHHRAAGERPQRESGNISHRPSRPLPDRASPAVPADAGAGAAPRQPRQCAGGNRSATLTAAWGGYWCG
jgi:hypothetical protein